MMRDDIENGHSFSGARRRNAPSNNNGIGYGHSYSSIPTHAPQHDYGNNDIAHNDDNDNGDDNDNNEWNESKNEFTQV